MAKQTQFELTVFFSREQFAWLSDEAAAIESTIAEVLRQLVNERMEQADDRHV